MMRRPVARLAAMLLGVAVLLTLVVAGDRLAGPPGGLSTVADIGQFNPGNIISDSLFFDGAAMTASEIQGFLEVKGMSCRTGSDGTPCLKNYRQDTTARAADSYCAGYTPAAQEPAAVIISKIAASCDISPRALLVILQKEQGLVTSTGGAGLTALRYQKAMGYACPDTAACDAAYYGFQNQMYSAARRFQQYAASPTSFGYRAGRTNTILFNPDGACGSSGVYIQNQATAGLYIYTPYQPNAAALAAGYGAAPPCGAYGNRNFWLYFTDWFGSTQRPGESAWQPLGHLDAATPRTGNWIGVSGWAVDPDTADMIAVHVYVDGKLRGEFPANTSRPDIAAILPAYGDQHGFDVTVSVSPGRHDVCAFAINVGAPAVNPSLGCLSVDTTGLPLGNIESAVIDEGQAVLSGWAFDPDTTTPIDVHAYVAGVLTGYTTAGSSRSDVGAVYPGSGDSHGFTVRASLQPGVNEVCLYGINVPGAGFNPNIGCRTVTLQVDPFGSLEQVKAGASTVTVTGWAIDPETKLSIDVRVSVDGVDVATESAGESRSDLAAYFPRLGVHHGYSFSVPAAPGDHQVCVTAVNMRLGTTDTLLGCRTVNVGVAPIGNLEQVKATAFQAQVSGWALDADTSAPIDVHVYVGGRYAATANASIDRPDVGAAFPGMGSGHGFTVAVPLPAGRHTVCAYGINVLGGQGNPNLSCFEVTIAAGQSLPFGMLEGVTVDSGITRVSGWVIEPDAPTTPTVTHFYVDGHFSGALTAGDDRPDVGAAYPGAGAAHGYTGSFILPSGPHTICTYGINRGAGTVNSGLGCRQVTVP
jgi:hypothetical protein